MVDTQFLQSPQWLAILGISIVAVVCRSIWVHKPEPWTRAATPVPIPKPSSGGQPELSADAYYHIDALEDLDLENEEPLKIRPFKAKYYLTMAIENITANDLLAMDKTYATRIRLRKQLIRDHHDEVLAWNPIITPAVFELYQYFISTYLPRRFPTVYTLQKNSLLNHVTSESLPLTPSSTEDALQILGSNIDDDLLLLLPIEDGVDKGKYALQGFVTCFPSGFATREKLGLKLADIHGPVPGYASKLEKSMDRFFASLPVGKVVKRHNWGITTDDRLFATSGNHMSEAEHSDRTSGPSPENGGGVEDDSNVDLRQVFLRTERQTLHRLPETGAILFAFKTYQYGLEEVRDEGNGEALAEAIEGLGTGNVPGMRVYKREVVWGEKVKAFLRGEVGIDGKPAS
ncbi:hypothetical protein DM02DRAFT_715372 [Periconia macrospinosa]|uniref:HRQ family protein 2 n=1 Tax=Periconia macrospinosa TaxID=97972 RepID=A0A2V1E6P7_9PLEO|nr:hypothetical protein DM02DRAFT_715372 [Periconia macrospinosa]